MKRIKKCIGFLLIFSGFVLFFYPTVSTGCLAWRTEEYIRDYKIKWKSEEEQEGSTDAYYKAIQEYNALIFGRKQSGFGDAWFFEQTPVELEGFEEGEFGYIEIPAMDTKLSLFIGATTENLAKGAAILGETSIPIGQSDSNSVIAGHRGYQGKPFFREIEKLVIGDEVYIVNPWETLLYRVESIRIIDPYDADAVKIQEGKDMITLLTCHPYRSNGKYRYVVYCIRDEESVLNQSETDQVISTIKGYTFVSSTEDIARENILRKICGLFLILLCTIYFFRTFLKNKDNKK